MSDVANELLDWANLSCRFRLKDSDFNFIKNTLHNDKLPPNIWQLFQEDLTIREQILGSRTLFKKILEHPGYLPISLELYFYVLVGKTLSECGFDNPKLIDYIVALLVRRVHSKAAFNANGNDNQSSFYIMETLQQISLQESEENRFFLQVLLANQTLFLTGLCEDYIKTRTNRRGGPNIEFFQSVGETQYLQAWKNPLAEEFNLRDIFQILGNSYGEVRWALSRFSDRLISFGEPLL